MNLRTFGWGSMSCSMFSSSQRATYFAQASWLVTRLELYQTPRSKLTELPHHSIRTLLRLRRNLEIPCRGLIGQIHRAHLLAEERPSAMRLAAGVTLAVIADDPNNVRPTDHSFARRRLIPPILDLYLHPRPFVPLRRVRLE